MKIECPWVYRDADESWRCATTYDGPTAPELLAAHLVYLHAVSPDFAERVTHRYRCQQQCHDIECMADHDHLCHTPHKEQQ